MEDKLGGIHLNPNTSKEREAENKWNPDKYRWVTETHSTFLEVCNNRRFDSKECRLLLLNCWIRNVVHRVPVSIHPHSPHLYEG